MTTKSDARDQKPLWAGVILLNGNGSVRKEGRFGRVTGAMRLDTEDDLFCIGLTFERDSSTTGCAPIMTRELEKEYSSRYYNSSLPRDLASVRELYFFALFNDEHAANAYVVRRCAELQRRHVWLEKLVRKVETAVPACPFCNRLFKLRLEDSVILEPNLPRFYLWKRFPGNPFSGPPECICMVDSGLCYDFHGGSLYAACRSGQEEQLATKALMAVLNELHLFLKMDYSFAEKRWKYRKENVEIPTSLDLGTVYVDQTPIAWLSARLYNWEGARGPTHYVREVYWQFVIEAVIPEDVALLDRVPRYVANDELLQRVVNGDYEGLDLTAAKVHAVYPQYRKPSYK